MKDWSSTSRFRVTSSTLARSFGDNVALAHMSTRHFHLLNPTATLIWNSVCAGRTIGEMERNIAEQYNVDPAELSKSVDAVLTMLSSEAFIEIQP